MKKKNKLEFFIPKKENVLGQWLAEEGIKKTVQWYLENKEWMDRVTSGDYQDYYKKMYK